MSLHPHSTTRTGSLTMCYAGLRNIWNSHSTRKSLVIIPLNLQYRWFGYWRVTFRPYQGWRPVGGFQHQCPSAQSQDSWGDQKAIDLGFHSDIDSPTIVPLVSATATHSSDYEPDYLFTVTSLDLTEPSRGRVASLANADGSLIAATVSASTSIATAVATSSSVITNHAGSIEPSE